MIVVADQKSQMNSLAVPAKLMNLCVMAHTIRAHSRRQRMISRSTRHDRKQLQQKEAAAPHQVEPKEPKKRKQRKHRKLRCSAYRLPRGCD